MGLILKKEILFQCVTKEPESIWNGFTLSKCVLLYMYSNYYFDDAIGLESGLTHATWR